MQNDSFMWFPDEAGKLGSSRPVGESRDAWFSTVGAFEIESFKFEVALKEAPTVTDSGSTAKRGIKFGRLTVVKAAELASVLLYRACTERTKIPTAIVITRLSSGDDSFMYLQFVFRDVRIDKVEWDQGEEARRTKETVELRFSEMALQYIPQKATGVYGKARCWTWTSSGNQAPANAVKTYNYFVRPYEKASSWKGRQEE